MSMMLMVKAMQIKVGNPLRKLVLLKLADNASDQGECWPSYQYIADQCEISKRSVMSHIDDLCQSGLLKKSSGRGRKAILQTSTSSPCLVQEIHYLVQEIHYGVVQELHPESVTLLNQSMNLTLSLGAKDL